MIFSSGKSVSQAKKDAKRLAKSSGVPLHEALDVIAKENSTLESWCKAVEQLKTNNPPFTIFTENDEDPSLQWRALISLGESGTGKTESLFQSVRQALTRNHAIFFIEPFLSEWVRFYSAVKAFDIHKPCITGSHAIQIDLDTAVAKKCASYLNTPNPNHTDLRYESLILGYLEDILISLKNNPTGCTIIIDEMSICRSSHNENITYLLNQLIKLPGVYIHIAGQNAGVINTKALKHFSFLQFKTRNKDSLVNFEELREVSLDCDMKDGVAFFLNNSNSKPTAKIKLRPSKVRVTSTVKPDNTIVFSQSS